jgi:hypothetical protein
MFAYYKPQPGTSTLASSTGALKVEVALKLGLFDTCRWLRAQLRFGRNATGSLVCFIGWGNDQQGLDFLY